MGLPPGGRRSAPDLLASLRLPRCPTRKTRRCCTVGVALTGPPPLRPFGLILRRDGRFKHEGVEVTHAKLHQVFLSGVRYAEEEGVFIVQLGRFRGQIEVEDTPYWVTSFDALDGTVRLTDQSEEPLAVASLGFDEDGVLRCRVKERFSARFERGAQAELLQAIHQDSTVNWLQLAGKRVQLPF